MGACWPPKLRDARPRTPRMLPNIPRIAVAVALCSAAVALATTPQAQPTPELEIRLARDDDASRATRAQLERLVAQTPGIAEWISTSSILIDSDPRAIPHSHPVLTLSTRHLLDDDLLLATFVHEQLHWYIGQQATLEHVRAGLRAAFPTVPVGHPDGANDELSTYNHLLLCWLEIRAMKALVGELRAHQILDFWQGDHYRWIYRQVAEKGYQIWQVVNEAGFPLPNTRPSTTKPPTTPVAE